MRQEVRVYPLNTLIMVAMIPLGNLVPGLCAA
ncbi:hypothetical protein GGR01_000012 [Acetobacter oeni]|nr:hypothetical protein [Acetobacter oeni]